MSYLELIAEVDASFAKTLANWFVNIELPMRRDEAEPLHSTLTNQGRLHLYKVVYELIQANKLSSSNAKILISKVLTYTEPLEDIAGFAKQHNLIQESDEGALTKIAAQVIEENPKAAEDVKNGEMKAIGFLVGQVMKLSQGRANPQIAQELLRKQLGI